MFRVFVGPASRITPRNLFDFGLGADSLWKRDSLSLGAQLFPLVRFRAV